MSADTVVAVCAAVIALGSLWVSVVQSRSTVRHNRQSVRPLVQLRQVRLPREGRAGLWAINAGLGPAVVTRTDVYLDGALLGQWNLTTFRRVFAGAPREPSISALFTGSVMLPGVGFHLLRLEPFEESADDWFWDLVAHRLRIEIGYESLYGGEGLRAVPPPL